MAVAIASFAILAAPGTTVANHSIPSPQFFWDWNNNGVADTTNLYTTAAGNWTALQLTQLDAAAAQWRVNTTFDLQDNGIPDNHNVYVDGRTGWCLGSWPGGVYGVTCRTFQVKSAYYRIVDTDTFTNTTAPGHATWNFSSAQILSAADFRGYLTHELGHWVRLTDLATCGNPMETMCGSQSYAQTFNSRTLTNDDIAGANVVY